MAEKNNIDNLFRDNLSNQELDFNPEAWAKMESLINAQEKKRRVGWYVFGAGMAAALVVVFGLSIYSSSLKHNQVAVNSQPKIKSTNKSIISIDSAKVKDVQSSTEVKERKQEKTDSKKTIDNQIVEKQTTVDTVSTNQNVSLNKQTLSPMYVDEDFVNNNTEYIEEDANLSAKEKRQIKKQNRTEEKLALMEYKVATLKVAEESHADLRDIEMDKTSFINKVNINIVGGINCSQGFLNSNLTRTAPSIDPVIGLGASIIVNSLVSLDINALYHKRGGLSPEKLPEVYSDKGTTEKSISLHYMDIPFYINYRFQNRHAVRFGLQYSHLLGTVAEISSSTTNTTWKKQNYYANYDVAGIIGYKYLINERFNVGVRGNFGLFDVTLGQSVGENTFDMNRQVRFLLEYKLSKY